MIRTFLDHVKRGAAAVTDGLAALGERMPGLSQVTISAPGVSVTVTPAPPVPSTSQQPPRCSTCGR